MLTCVCVTDLWGDCGSRCIMPCRWPRRKFWSTSWRTSWPDIASDRSLLRHGQWHQGDLPPPTIATQWTMRTQWTRHRAVTSPHWLFMAVCHDIVCVCGLMCVCVCGLMCVWVCECVKILPLVKTASEQGQSGILILQVTKGPFLAIVMDWGHQGTSFSDSHGLRSPTDHF